MTLAETFREEALLVVRERADLMRTTLSYAGALCLPEVDCQDIVVAGKEVQLTIYRQANLPFLGGPLLVTIQIARHALGGVKSFHMEKGVVFSSQAPPKDATDQELLDSGV